MKIKSLIKHNLMRAAMTLVLIMTCATAWADNVSTYYIDENGTRHDVTATVVTTYMDNLGTDGETTWYVVNENIFLDGSDDQTHLHGNVNLIIADGCELQSAAGSNGPNDGFRGSGNLTLYGQTAGTGTLSCGQEGFMNITGDFTVCSGMVSVSGNFYNAIRAANFTMRGGSVSITNNTNNDCGIRATGTVNIYSGSVVAMGTTGIEADIVNIYGGSVTARCNGRNASGSNYGYAIKCSSTFNFYGGNVTAQGDYNWHEGQTRYGIHANSINLSWTSTDDWIYNTKDGNSDNVICYFAGSGGMNIAPYKPFTDGTTTYTGTLTDEQVEALADKTLQPVVPAFANSGDGTPEHPYTIYNVTGWNVFCEALQDNNTWNHFSGKYVKLGANISIMQSAGSAGHEFMGTFDGDGKTLTVDITETTTQGTAPFREINGATIQNLVVTGSVDGTTHAAGLVGFARGADATTVNTITNCKVATNVTVTTPSGNNYHCGGVVGHALQCTLNMSNTVYCGDITNSGNYVGGLQGWSDGNTINFSHCLFVGSYSGTASFHPVAVRNNNNATTADVSHVYYTVTPTLTNSSFIAANGTKTTGLATAPAGIGTQGATYSFMNMTVYQNGLYYNGLYYAAPTLSTDNDNAYLINNVDDWAYFCEMLYDNDTWNRFIGQTVKLGADIGVSRMAGADTHDFCGTFDGQNNTLTFTATATDNYLAPFRNVSGTSETNHAVIQNLNVVTNITAIDFRHAAGLIAAMFNHVDVANCNVTANITATKGGQTELYPAGLVSQVASGAQLTVSGCTVSGTISTDGKYAGGMVGIVQGSASITNSVSSVTINSSTSGDGTHGGFVASLVSGRQLTIEGCVFNGKIVTTNGLTTKCGGFLGHNNTEGGTGATITNCLYAPTTDPNTVSTGCSTFGRNVSSNLISNCYYTTALGDAQGTQAYSITAGDYVTTLANAGTVSNNYTTSGLIFYNVGLKYGDVLYAAENDVVSLTLAHQDREGYDFIGYTATAGNLNGSTLTMPDGNVTINAEYTCTAPSELAATDITFTTATLNWNGLQESYNVRCRTVGANEWQTIDNIAVTTTTLSGLLSGTTYEWQVQGLDCDGEGGTTEWSAATFTTLSTCEVQPSELTATDITATTATLNWNGSQESYNVRYQPVVILNEGFESGTMPDGWTSTGSYWQVTSGTGYDDYTGAATGNYNAGCYINSSNRFDILITPVMDLGNVASATLSFNFWNNRDGYGEYNILKVHYRVDEGEWHLLYTYGNPTNRWIPVTINLEGMAAHYQIGFEYESHYSYGMGIDDVMVIGINTSEWTTVTNVSSPHDITGLTPETQYVWQVQGLECNGEGSTTEWSESGTFTTPNPCEVQPSELTAAATATTATLNWNGFQESYSVRYLPFILYEGFESGTMPDGWTRTNENWEVTSGTGYYDHTGAATGNYNAGCFIGNYVDSDILITPVMDLGNVASAALSFNFWNTGRFGNINILKVYYRVDGGEWHSLYTYEDSTEGWIPVTIILEGLAANYQIGFEYKDRNSYGMGIDDVMVTGINTSEWTTVTNVSSPHNLTGLTPETQYLWQVQGLDCDGEGSTTEWSEMGIFTTLAGIYYIKEITAHGTNTSDGGWYLIASPVGGVAATDVVNLVATTTPENPTNFDLYRFNQAAELEWENWKQQNSDHYHFDLEPGRGYLYANAADVNLVFAGTPYRGNGEVTITNVAGHPLSGWNLVGNPFSVDAYIGRDFYVLNEARSEVMPEASTGAIPSMEGVFVLAEQDEETVTFSTEALNKGRASKPEQVVLNLSRDRGLVIDRAIVRMGEGRTLPKFQLNRNSTKLYIPQDGTDYAIACAESTGEMPLNFRAKENGEYTITVNPENVEMAYLHLVDNMTGTDIDLLSPSLTPLNAEHLRAERSNPDQPATYTFTAKTTDYESRFKLVFASNNEDGPSTGSGTFAFYSNGNWIIANEGEATLQVIDITGRILSSETVNGSVSKSIQAAPGVYVLRLINGDNVKVQKIVVR